MQPFKNFLQIFRKLSFVKTSDEKGIKSMIKRVEICELSTLFPTTIQNYQEKLFSKIVLNCAKLFLSYRSYSVTTLAACNYFLIIGIAGLCLPYNQLLAGQLILSKLGNKMFQNIV